MCKVHVHALAEGDPIGIGRYSLEERHAQAYMEALFHRSGSMWHLSLEDRLQAY